MTPIFKTNKNLDKFEELFVCMDVSEICMSYLY